MMRTLKLQQLRKGLVKRAHKALSLTLALVLINAVVPYGVFAGDLSSDYVTISPDHKRISGFFSDAGTAIAASKAGWAQGSQTVVIADERDAAFACIAAPLAAAYDAPVLLAGRYGFLDDAVRAEIERLGATRAIVVGRSGAEMRRLTADVAAAGPNVRLLAGSTAPATSVTVAAALREVSAPGRLVFSSSGDTQRLILLAADAARTASPLLLVDTTTIPVARLNAILDLGAKSALLCGVNSTAAITLSSALRKTGAKVARPSGDTEKVSAMLHTAALADARYAPAKTVVIGAKAGQSLAAPALAAHLGAPVVYSATSGGSDASRDQLLNNCSEIKQLYVVGDIGSLSPVGEWKTIQDSSAILRKNTFVIDPDEWPNKRLPMLSDTKIISVDELQRPQDKGSQGFVNELLDHKTVHAGDYIVIMPCEQRKSGMFAKVLNTPSRLGATFTYDLQSVPLGEVVKQGSITKRQLTKMRNDKLDAASSNTEWNSGYEQSIGATAELRNTGADDPFGLKGSGGVSASITLEVHLEFVDGQLKDYEFSYTVAGTATAELTAWGELAAAKSWTKTLATYRGRPITVWIGPVPIVLMPTLEYRAGLSGKFRGEFTANWTWNVSTTRTYKREGNHKSYVFTDTKPPKDLPDPTITGSLTGSVKFTFAEIVMSLKIFGLAGPTMTIAAGVSATSTAASTSGIAKWNAACSIEFEAKIGLSCDVLNLGADLTLLNAKFEVWTAHGYLGDSCVGLVRLKSKANNNLRYANISSNGQYVVFDSSATNLVPGVTGHQIYRLDLNTGNVLCVSRASNGTPMGDASRASLSADGSRVAWLQLKSGVGAVWLRDIASGATQRIDVSSKSRVANAAAQNVVMSSDGKSVVFSSPATNLIDGATTSGAMHLFVRNVSLKTTTCVSRAAGDKGNGTPVTLISPNYELATLSLSSNGKLVVFTTPGPGGDVSKSRVYLRNLDTNTTRLLSNNSKGTVFPAAHSPQISADGKYVTFVGDSASGINIWRKTLANDVLERVNVDNSTQRKRLEINVRANSPSFAYFTTVGRMSSNGQYVVFGATRRTAKGVGNIETQLYVRDVVNNTTSSITSKLGAEFVPLRQMGATVSGDGNRYVFIGMSSSIQSLQLYLRNAGNISRNAR